MMLPYERCTPQHIRHVVHKSWDRGRKEMALLGFDDEEKWIEHIHAMSAEHGYTAMLEDEPVAVFGAVKVNGTYYTFFAATDKFGVIGRALTRVLRTYLRIKLAEQPDARLELGSVCQHPKADAWFEALGFVLQERNGLLRKYLYVRGKKPARVAIV